jgi:DNA-binding GntR family transcriptional regulator
MDSSAGLVAETDKSPDRRLARRDSLAERIYIDLLNRLQTGRVAAGQRLVDLELASEYGTSRMPAREALLRLANEGYLVGTSRGFVAPRLSLEDIREIFEVRRLLEPRAAANAARELTAADEAKLAAALSEARNAAAADDTEKLILANMAFRAAWLGAVRNRRLAETISRFVDHVQTVRLGTLADPETRQIVNRGLEGLFAAFRKRDPDAAYAHMADFMAAAEQAFFAVRKAQIEGAEREDASAGAANARRGTP